MPAPPAAQAIPRPRCAPETGAQGETLAAAHLERLGLRVIARNVRLGAGEIDLIAFGQGTLVFAEVKTTRLRPGGRAPVVAPLERLGRRQRLRLRRTALRWLAECPQRPPARRIRFDAVGVLLDPGGRLAGLEHLEDAF
jgi:putative endonuclease